VGGYSLRLLAGHLLNHYTDKQALTAQHLRPAMQAAGDYLLDGNFNFVEADSMDRISSAAAQQGLNRPVAAHGLQLAAKLGARGSGLPRARLHQVMADAAAKQHLEQYKEESAAAAAGP
jgi:hypothetical protein